MKIKLFVQLIVDSNEDELLRIDSETIVPLKGEYIEINGRLAQVNFVVHTYEDEIHRRTIHVDTAS